MTLITVVFYDFVIFSRSKSRIFEKSTLSPCGYFMEIPAQKNKFDFFVPSFFVRLKTPRREKNFPFFAGTNVFTSAQTRLPRILTETL